MNQLSGPAPFAAKDKKAQKEIPKITNRFQELLSNTLFLDPVPYLMREDSYPNRRLQGNCSNLSGVLYTLWENEKNRPAILDFIKSLPEQDIKDIRFSKNGRGKSTWNWLKILEIKNEVSLPDYFQMVLCVSWLLPPLCCQFRKVRLL